MPVPRRSDEIPARVVQSSSSEVDMPPSARVRDLFRRLSRAATVGTEGADPRSGPSHLDPRTRALAIIGAAVCADSPTNTFRAAVSTALASDASEQEILGVLFAVAPAAGESRLVSVTPRVSKVLGYDIDEDFEVG
jgi:alkylhydroperoxidase/carboxymuconolactone decarboxylase family protein YurZ